MTGRERERDHEWCLTGRGRPCVVGDRERERERPCVVGDWERERDYVWWVTGRERETMCGG